MNIHEYQAKEIFKRYGIPINEGRLARTPEEAFQAAEELIQKKGGHLFAVKAQVHAGGRGKGGGIRVVKTAEEVRQAASEILGTRLITPQSGPEGKPVDYLLIEATEPIEKEFYTSIVLDRSAEKPCIIASAAGGMDIEEAARLHPEKIFKIHFSPVEGLTAAEAAGLASRFNLTPDQAGEFSQIFQSMSKIFLELDVSLIEINPLSIIKGGRVLAIDAKINFDDNGLYLHPEVAQMFDPRQEDPREVEAKKFDLSYVGLDGNIGCVVNGAGLAMATMDIIKYAGGDPANFLDVGGGASKEKVAAAFKIILTDPKVKAILVNIFGGIMRCDVVAEGILAAVQELGSRKDFNISKIPIVVRLEGTNVNEGRAILEKSSLKVISAASFEEAAEKVVGAAG